MGCDLIQAEVAALSANQKSIEEKVELKIDRLEVMMQAILSASQMMDAEKGVGAGRARPIFDRFDH